MDSPQRLLVSFPVAADRIGDFDPGRYHQIRFTISIGEVYRVILFRLFGMGSMEQFSSAAVVVVWLIRLPRLVGGSGWYGVGILRRDHAGDCEKSSGRSLCAGRVVWGFAGGNGCDHARIRLLFGR